jgi:hypothetical protein
VPFHARTRYVRSPVLAKNPTPRFDRPTAPLGCGRGSSGLLMLERLARIGTERARQTACGSAAISRTQRRSQYK